MTCSDIDDLVDITPASLRANPQIAEHLEHCRSCHALLRAFDQAVEPASAPAAAWKPIETTILKNLQPVRPLASRAFFLLASATIFLGVVWAGAAPFVMAGWHGLSYAQRTSVFAALAASALLLCFSMVGQMVPGAKYSLASSLVPAFTLAVLLIVLAVGFRPKLEAAFFSSGLACVKKGLTCSIPAFVLYSALARRGAMLDRKVIGATSGGLAGLTGLTVLEINCRNLNLVHILVWHWGTVLISCVIGMLLGAATGWIERLRGHGAG